MDKKNDSIVILEKCLKLNEDSIIKISAFSCDVGQHNEKTCFKCSLLKYNKDSVLKFKKAIDDENKKRALAEIEKINSVMPTTTQPAKKKDKKI